MLRILVRHREQILKTGFDSVEDFIETVTRGYAEIICEWEKEIKPEPTIGSSTNTDTTGVNLGRTDGVTVTSGNSPLISESKGSDNMSNPQVEGEKLTFRDDTPVPLDEDGEADFSQMSAEHIAEWFIDYLGADGKDVVDVKVDEAKAALDKAEAMRIEAGKNGEEASSATIDDEKNLPAAASSGKESAQFSKSEKTVPFVFGHEMTHKVRGMRRTHTRTRRRLSL